MWDSRQVAVICNLLLLDTAVCGFLGRSQQYVIYCYWIPQSVGSEADRLAMLRERHFAVAY